MNNDILTLYGKAEFVWLNEPDTKFDPAGKYKVDLKVTEKEATPVIALIKEGLAKQPQPKNHNLPYTKQSDGTYIFKMKSKFKPKLWDKDQHELDPNLYIWKDSTMWVQFKLNLYKSPIAVGVTLYMNNVQIDNLVKGSSQNGACPFPKRSGSALPGPEKAVAL